MNDMQEDCKQRRAVPDIVLLPRYSDSVVRASHCISFTIPLLTVLGRLNCEREENNAAWKNKTRIRAILKEQAVWEEEKIRMRGKREKRKTVIYIPEWYFPIEKKILNSKEKYKNFSSN